MNKFVIVDGLPYLYFNGKTYAVRWDEKGFTVGAEVELTSVPTVTYSEISVKAKCAGHLDSIGENALENPENPEGQNNDENAPQTPENPENPEEEKQDEESVGAEKSIDDMTLAELKDYAKENGIALNGARTKDTIIEAIKGAE